jgi:hypothetical protein
MTVCDELEWLWKEALVARFKVPSRNLPGEVQENYEKISG